MMLGYKYEAVGIAFATTTAVKGLSRLRSLPYNRHLVDESRIESNFAKLSECDYLCETHGVKFIRGN